MPTSIEIPSVPNCVVTVLFDRHRAHFSYTCAHSSAGWQVLPDGNIIPPSHSRVVQFRLKNWPPVEGAPGSQNPQFAGFQVVPAGDDLPSEAIHWPPLPREIGNVTFYPSSESNQNDATIPFLTLDFGTGRWAYRLAVLGADGKATWDDPKIHDDGSDW